MTILRHTKCFEGIEVAGFFIGLELALNGGWGRVGARRLPRQNKQTGFRDLTTFFGYFKTD